MKRSAHNRPAVLIVGGLGSLGDALTPKLIAAGYTVVIADLAKAVDAASRKHHTVQRLLYSMDVTKAESIETFRRQIEQDNIQLSHVINVVGELNETGLTDIFQTTAEEISSTININLKGQLFVVRFLGEHLRNAPGDKSFTMISSINAHQGYSIPIYSASKGGLHGFIRPAAIDLGRYGIRINIVTPGTVRTPVTEQQPKNFTARAESAALKRLCSVDEVADGILAAIHLTGMNGQEIIIDAGQSVNPSESLYDQNRCGTAHSEHRKQMRWPTIRWPFAGLFR